MFKKSYRNRGWLIFHDPTGYTGLPLTFKGFLIFGVAVIAGILAYYTQAVVGQLKTAERRMANYYLYILSSRHHRHLQVGVTPDLARGVTNHRLRINRRLRKKRVLQKLVYVESIASIEEAVQREVRLSRAPRQELARLVETVNPGWDSISLSQLVSRGY